MAEENAMDPIHQFVIKPIVSLHPFGIDASFTNASLFMMIVVLSAAALMLLGTQSRALVPSRLQSLAEMAYQFVASTVHMQPYRTRPLYILGDEPDHGDRGACAPCHWHRHCIWPPA